MYHLGQRYFRIRNYYACPQERRDVGQQKENYCSINQLDIVSEYSAGLRRGVGNKREHQFVKMECLNVRHKTFHQDEILEGCASSVCLCTGS